MAVSEFANLRNVVTVAVSSSGTYSAVGDLYGSHLVGIQMSTAWTAADLHPIASADSSSTGGLRAVYNSTGGLVRWKADASRYVLPAQTDYLRGIRYLALRSINTGSTAAVKQAAARSIKLVVSPRG